MNRSRSSAARSSAVSPSTRTLLADLVRAHGQLLIELAAQALAHGLPDLAREGEDLVQDVCLEVLSGGLHLTPEPATALRELARAIGERARRRPPPTTRPTRNPTLTKGGRS